MVLNVDKRCAAIALLCLAAGGCSDSQLKLPPVTAALGNVSVPTSQSDDPPVEVYARIARGALKCWFGPEGSLKQTHVFHAKADPPSAGGAAEIGVHTRETGSSHGVLKAFGVTIAPAAGGTLVEAQNVRFPDGQSQLMIQDVGRWVAGEDSCSIVGTGGWQAGQPQAQVAAPAPATKPAPKVQPPAQR